MGSVGSTPLRSKRAEEFIRGQKVTDTIIENAAQIASEDSQPISDVHASEEYKREMIKVLVKHTVKEAMARAAAASDRG
jgi:carbon-monoxide dehydrogenase medium subunit